MNPTSKNLDRPDENLSFSRGSAQVVTVEGATVARGRLDPGWRWSNDIQPGVGTPSCQLQHRGVVPSGSLHVEADEGSAMTLVPGDVFLIPPGHDAWVVGEGEVVTLEWEGAEEAAELWA